MSYGYTYRTTNRVNGKVYVGQRRRGVDLGYLGSGTQIRRAIKKYGRQVFSVEVLDFAEDKAGLDRAEQRPVIEHRSLFGGGNCYNITPGGEGVGKGSEHPMWGRKHSLESRKAMSEKRKGEGNWLFGNGHSIRGSKNPNFGRHLSDETKRKIGLANRAIRGASHGNFGRVRSAETRAKISASKTGRVRRSGWVMTEEHKAKISASRKACFAAGFKMQYSVETRKRISDGVKRYRARLKEAKCA